MIILPRQELCKSARHGLESSDLYTQLMLLVIEKGCEVTAWVYISLPVSQKYSCMAGVCMWWIERGSERGS